MQYCRINDFNNNAIHLAGQLEKVEWDVTGEVIEYDAYAWKFLAFYQFMDIDWIITSHLLNYYT